ncbi:hypothetical protein NQ315_005064 [Exocentrus adspersus]|uniref:ascorbate ferrireductase (transmembrane) n=1 Tax=Exocentrus adspersus TaxID=1586481 RepID=A0AAV8VPK4_9CUCU|nr:hypothetical protein NQ315_005064 [Exocentrus adspersus]
MVHQPGTAKERSLLIIDTLFQQLLAVFVLLILWEVFKNYNFNNAHAWHVVLCTLGFGLCMAEALLLFNKENSFLVNVDRAKRGSIHAAVMFLGFACITAGIALKINQKEERGSKHFTSTHGILGLVSWILTFISIILGILVGCAQKSTSLGRPASYRIVHLLLGVATYITGVVALGFGLHYLVGYTGLHGRNALIIFLALYVSYSLISSVKSCYNYFFG